VVDLGAQPFITSCALKSMGYDVTAVDVEPEPYMHIAERCGVKVVKRDKESNLTYAAQSAPCLQR